MRLRRNLVLSAVIATLVPACDDEPEGATAQRGVPKKKGDAAKPDAKAPKADAKAPTIEPDKPALELDDKDAKADAKADTKEEDKPALEVPEPCKIVEATFSRGSDKSEDDPLSLDAVAEVKAATIDEAWSSTSGKAPPLLSERQLGEKATANDDGTWKLGEDVTYALDVEGRPAAATYFDASAGGSIQLVYVYRYACDPVVVSGFPGNEEETRIKVKARATGTHPVFDDLNGNNAGEFEAKKNRELEWEESVVAIGVPRPVIVAKDITFKASGFDHASRNLGGEVEVSVPKGRVLDLYFYDGEGTCYLGAGDQVFVDSCPDPADHRYAGNSDTTPIAFEWWVRLASPKGWLKVDDAQFATELKGP